MMNMNTILLVEEQLPQKEMIAALLQNSGLSIILESHGVETLDKIKIQQSDLVILNRVMPRMNGDEVYRPLKNALNTKDLSIVIYATKREKLERVWRLKKGAYVDNKPFNST